MRGGLPGVCPCFPEAEVLCPRVPCSLGGTAEETRPRCVAGDSLCRPLPPGRLQYCDARQGKTEEGGAWLHVRVREGTCRWRV